MDSYRLLEHDFAQFTEVPVDNMVACSSGTAALHLAIEALGLPLGSKILVPDFSMIACPRAVTLAGMVPVFVDCRADDLNIDPTLVERALIRDGNIAAIMAVHTYGRRCDMDRIVSAADAYDAFVIEDLAEAHGVKPHPTTDACAWSFYRNKIIHGEEGGAVSFRRLEHANAARQLRCMGFNEAHDFTHRPRGHNYRLANCLADLIRASLRNYAGNVNERRFQEMLFDKSCPPGWRMPARLSPWVYDMRVTGMTQAEQSYKVDTLVASGMQARRAFKPNSTQVEYSDCEFVGSATNHVAAKASSEVFYLPFVPGVRVSFPSHIVTHGRWLSKSQ